MVNRYCKCCHHLAGRADAAANFYNNHFIPDHWALSYFKLSECCGVSLMGCCKDCGGELEEIISFPKGLTGNALFQAVYDTVQTAHPYDSRSDALGYYGRCKERSEFYKCRDQRSQFRRSKEFLNLFNDWDREAARLWLEQNFPPEKPTEVFRDTGGSLFSSVIRMAKASGGFDKAGAILDYYLPCEHESGIREGVALTAYEFDFAPILNYGSEGIYIDCYLKGKFNESGRFSLHVGTLKTLRRDLEAEKIMGELCGVLHYYENQYVNQNLHRYTPTKQLEAEYQRQLEKKNVEEGGAHE